MTSTAKTPLFPPQIEYAEGQLILEHLIKEADYIKMKNGQRIYGNVNMEGIQESFILIKPLLKDTFFRAYWDDIEDVEFYEEEQ